MNDLGTLNLGQSSSSIKVVLNDVKSQSQRIIRTGQITAVTTNMLVILLESPRRERASSNSTMLQLSHQRMKTDILHISLSKYSDTCLTLCDKPDCYLSMWNIADKSVDSTGRQTKKLIGKYNDILPDLQLQTLTKK
eukprot:scaffold15219_cov221-Alexandrium_tamarense.AAC.3